MGSKAVARTEIPAEPTVVTWYAPTKDTSLAQQKNFVVVSLSPLSQTLSSASRRPLFTSHRLSAAGYECYRDAAGNARCRTPLTTTQNPSGTSSSSTPTPTSSTPTTPASNISSAVTLKSAFNLFGITLLLGWIGKPFRVSRLYRC